MITLLNMFRATMREEPLQRYYPTYIFLAAQIITFVIFLNFWSCQENPVQVDSPVSQHQTSWCDSTKIIIREAVIGDDSLEINFMLPQDLRLLLEAYIYPDSTEIVLPGSGNAAGSYMYLWLRPQNSLNPVFFKFWEIEDSITTTQIGELKIYF